MEKIVIKSELNSGIFSSILNKTKFFIFNDIASQKKIKFLLPEIVEEKYIEGVEQFIFNLGTKHRKKGIGFLEMELVNKEEDIICYGDYKDIGTTLTASGWNNFINNFSSEFSADLQVRVSSLDEAKKIFSDIVCKEEQDLTFFNKISGKLYKDIGAVLIYSLSFLQKYILSEKELKELQSIKENLLKIVEKEEVKNSKLEMRLNFHILCIREKIIQFSSEDELNLLFEDWLKLLLKFDLFYEHRLSFFVSTPLRQALYNYIICVKKMAEMGEKKCLGNKKAFYTELIEKSSMVMGNSYFSGRRPITLNFVHRFVEKYRNEFNNYVRKSFKIEELYKYFFEFSKIQSLIFLNYSSEAVLSYEENVLITEQERVYPEDLKINDKKLNFENLQVINPDLKNKVLIKLDNLRDCEVMVTCIKNNGEFEKTDYVIEIDDTNLKQHLNDYKTEELDREIEFLIKSSRILLGENFSKSKGNYYARFLNKKDKFFIFEITFLYSNQTESFIVALAAEDFICKGKVESINKII